MPVDNACTVSEVRTHGTKSVDRISMDYLRHREANFPALCYRQMTGGKVEESRFWSPVNHSNDANVRPEHMMHNVEVSIDVSVSDLYKRRRHMAEQSMDHWM
jgi:hypothetical protein